MKIVENILSGRKGNTFYSLPGKIGNPMSVQAFQYGPQTEGPVSKFTVPYYESVV